MQNLTGVHLFIYIRNYDFQFQIGQHDGFCFVCVQKTQKHTK